MQCRRVVNEARRSQHGFGVLDVGRDLAMLNIWHPDEANWEPLLALLAEINVAPRHKNGALTLLADTAELIPDSVVHELRRIAEEVAAHPHLPQPLEPTDRSALGPALDLIAALPGSAPTFGDLRQQIFTLLAGDDGDRSQAAKLASRGAGAATVGLLVGLLQDSHPSVRSTAAASLVRIGTRSASVTTDAERVAADAIDQAILDPGTAVARGVVAAYLRSTCRPPQQILDALSQHASAAVRGYALKVAADSETRPAY